MSFVEKEYLIIGGTTKAATTSLFFYLKDHPEICASSIKESRYWLSQEYPLTSASRYTGVNEYETYFDQCDSNNLRMEATPDYLYSLPTPKWIHHELKSRAKIIFILRNPIDRLISWYNFAKQDGYLKGTETLEGYLQMMLQFEDSDPQKQHLLTLRQGKYMDYLEAWYDQIPKEQIKLILFEDLVRNPKETLAEICDFANIKAKYYDQYNFEVVNKTVSLKSGRVHGIYKKLRFKIRNKSHKHPAIHGALKALRERFEPIYLKLNEKKESTVDKMSNETYLSLKDYYKSSHEALEKNLGYSLSEIWN